MTTAEQTLSFWQQDVPETVAFRDVEFRDFCEYSGDCTHRAKLSTPHGYYVENVRWNPRYPEDGRSVELTLVTGWAAWEFAALFGDLL